MRLFEMCGAFSDRSFPVEFQLAKSARYDQAVPQVQILVVRFAFDIVCVKVVEAKLYFRSDLLHHINFLFTKCKTDSQINSKKNDEIIIYRLRFVFVCYIQLPGECAITYVVSEVQIHRQLLSDRHTIVQVKQKLS